MGRRENAQAGVVMRRRKRRRRRRRFSFFLLIYSNSSITMPKSWELDHQCPKRKDSIKVLMRR